jgi:hypothetical protein
MTSRRTLLQGAPLLMVEGPAAEPAHNGERFFMFTHPRFEAPAGPYDWMNRAMFVGTLGARKDARCCDSTRFCQVTSAANCFAVHDSFNFTGICSRHP